MVKSIFLLRRGGERLDNDRFQTIKKLYGKLVVEIPESITRYFGLSENTEVQFTIDKERIVIKDWTPVFRAA